MIYIQLFFSFLQVGLFSFGGGYAAMPLIQGQVVTMHQWLSMSEFTDLITISQMTPRCCMSVTDAMTCCVQEALFRFSLAYSAVPIHRKITPSRPSTDMISNSTQ